MNLTIANKLKCALHGCQTLVSHLVHRMVTGSSHTCKLINVSSVLVTKHVCCIHRYMQQLQSHYKKFADNNHIQIKTPPTPTVLCYDMCKLTCYSPLHALHQTDKIPAECNLGNLRTSLQTINVLGVTT